MEKQILAALPGWMLSALSGLRMGTREIVPVSIDRVVWDIIDSERVQKQGNPMTYTWQSRGTKFVTYTVFPTFGASKSGNCTLEVG